MGRGGGQVTPAPLPPFPGAKIFFPRYVRKHKICVKFLNVSSI